MRLIPASNLSISEIIVPAYQAKMADLRSRRVSVFDKFTKIGKEVQGIDEELQKAIAEVKKIEARLHLAQQKQADAQVEIDRIDEKLKQQQEELDMMTGVANPNKRSAENEIDPPAKRSRTVESESAASSSAPNDAINILSNAGSSSAPSLPTQRASTQKGTKGSPQKRQGRILESFFKPGTKVYDSNREGTIQTFDSKEQTFTVDFGDCIENKSKSNLLYLPAIGDKILIKANAKQHGPYCKATVLETRKQGKIVLIKVRWDESGKIETKVYRGLGLLLPLSEDSDLSLFRVKLVTDSEFTSTGYHI
jgi:hypothetical protein